MPKAVNMCIIQYNSFTIIFNTIKLYNYIYLILFNNSLFIRHIHCRTYVNGQFGQFWTHRIEPLKVSMTHGLSGSFSGRPKKKPTAWSGTAAAVLITEAHVKLRISICGLSKAATCRISRWNIPRVRFKIASCKIRRHPHKNSFL